MGGWKGGNVSGSRREGGSKSGRVGGRRNGSVGWGGSVCGGGSVGRGGSIGRGGSVGGGGGRDTLLGQAFAYGTAGLLVAVPLHVSGAILTDDAVGSVADQEAVDVFGIADVNHFFSGALQSLLAFATLPRRDVINRVGRDDGHNRWRLVDRRVGQ